MPSPKPPFLLTVGQLRRLPSTRSRKVSIPHDATLYRQRHRIEIMFGRLKDWRRIAMRYDCCAHTFFSAITLAAIVIFWLGQ
jgi:transposase